jgi:hypothetical protein
MQGEGCRNRVVTIALSAKKRELVKAGKLLQDHNQQFIFLVSS